MPISYITKNIHNLKQHVTFTSFSLAESALVIKQHQPECIDLPKNPKGRSFQASWYRLYPWLHYDEEWTLHFVIHAS